MKARVLKACMIALAVFALLPPAGADQRGDRIAALTAKLAADLAEYRSRLALFDQIQRMEVARSNLGADQADRRLAAEASRLLRTELTAPDKAALIQAHRSGFAAFIGAVRTEAQHTGTWPAGGDAARWRQMAFSELDRLARSYESGLAAGDTLPVLSDVAKVQGWARGGAATDPFAGEQDRIIGAIPDPRARMLVEATTRPPRDNNGNIPAFAPIPPPAPATASPAPAAAVTRSPAPEPPPTTIAPQAPNPPQAWTQHDPTGLEFNTDRMGFDYADFDLPLPEPQLCRQVCLADAANCRAFTYANPGVYGRPSAHCWLKNPAPAPSANACCVSGLGTAPPAQQAFAPTPAAPPQPGARVALAYAWAALEPDPVGAFANGHWRASVQLDGEREVSYFAIKPADANGNALPTQYWDSRDPRRFALIVFANGQRLNAAYASSLGLWHGTLNVDLYGADPGGYLRSPGYTVLEMGLANGQVFAVAAPHPGQ